MRVTVVRSERGVPQCSGLPMCFCSTLSSRFLPCQSSKFRVLTLGDPGATALGRLGLVDCTREIGARATAHGRLGLGRLGRTEFHAHDADLSQLERKGQCQGLQRSAGAAWRPRSGQRNGTEAGLALHVFCKATYRPGLPQSKRSFHSPHASGDDLTGQGRGTYCDAWRPLLAPESARTCSVSHGVIPDPADPAAPATAAPMCSASSGAHLLPPSCRMLLQPHTLTAVAKRGGGHIRFACMNQTHLYFAKRICLRPATTDQPSLDKSGWPCRHRGP